MASNFNSETKIWKGADIPYPFPMDFMCGHLILPKLLENPDDIVQIQQDDGEALTYNELRISMIRVAQNLVKIGIKEDEVVGAILPQSNFTSKIVLGCTIIGAIVNPLDASMSQSDILSVFSQTKPKIIICQPDAISKVENSLKGVDFEFRIYSTSPDDSLYPSAHDFLKPTSNEENFEHPRFTKDSNEKLVALMGSSGTSGAPKAVGVSHAVALTWAALLCKLSPNIKKETVFATSPLCWGTGYFTNFTPIVLNELRIVPSPKPFDVQKFLEDVEKYQIQSITFPPFRLASVLNYEKVLSYNLDSIKTFTGTGGVISKNVREKFAKLFPDKQLSIVYGLTESGVSITKPFEYKLEYSVGSVLFPNISMKITDDDGNRLGPNEKGEICLTPFPEFVGYYGNEKATKDAFDAEGFFKTGDIGYFNDEGVLFVVDRKKEILKYKGYHINPSEIENVIQSIEGVELACVIGLPDELCYNLLTAAVVKRPGFKKLNEDKIITHVANIMPEYKQLHGGVYFYDKLPMTATGKIQKRFVLQSILNDKNEKSR